MIRRPAPRGDPGTPRGRLRGYFGDDGWVDPRDSAIHAAEQARGEVGSQDQRSDIYSLGAILYQILALRPPVGGGHVSEIIENVCAGRIEPLQPRPPGVTGQFPNRLAAVAMKALAMDPGKRYASVLALQTDIAAYQRGFATAAEHAGLKKLLALMLKAPQTRGRHPCRGCRRAARDRGVLFRPRHPRAQCRDRARKIARPSAARRRMRVRRPWPIVSRAETERNRANAALAELRKAAPAFQGQAGTLVEEQKI